MPQPPLSIDVVSDVVCPWCYLGKRRLERALSLLPEVYVDVRWQPFRLDPTIPPEGMDRRDYVIRKFGSEAALDQAHQRLAAMGREEGIEYRFERIQRSPNTVDAHRLVRWAALAGTEDAMVERLFAAYFRDGLDIGDHGVLADLAAEVGLDRDAVAARLKSDDDRTAVLAAIDDAYRIGVTGVPCFIFDRRSGVMGAQSAETLVRAIGQVIAERAAAPTT